MYKWGFIYTLDDGSTSTRIDTIGTLICVGVPAVENAPFEARRLVQQGVKLIELCGAFGGAGLASVLAAVENKVPVGAVFFGVDAAVQLHRLTGSAPEARSG